MNFVNDLFGTIAGPSIPFAGNLDFIPDGTGGTIDLKDARGTWLGLHDRRQQKYAYDYCFAVSTVVDRLAEYDLTGQLRFIKQRGKGKDKPVENEWSRALTKLFAQPNPLQSWEQFRGQQTVYKKVFGFCPILPLIPTGFENQPWNAYALINIPPWLIEPITNRTMVSGELKTLLKGWRVSLFGEIKEYSPDQIWILEDGFLQDERYDFLLPQSKLVGCDMSVSNICLAMEAENVLLQKKGPLGVISHDAAAKDNQVGYLPMQKWEKNQLQRDLDKYGLSLSKLQYIISRTSIKFVPFSYNVAELMTQEIVVAATKNICHRYSFPYILMEESESTYANGDNAIATVYQSNVIPNANKDINKYNKYFKAEENNAFIDIDFSAVGALQEDKKLSADAAYSMNQALEIEWLNDLITLNEWRVARGYEELPAEIGNKRKSELTKKENDTAPEDPPAA